MSTRSQSKTYVGFLYPHWETGTEGVIWSVLEDPSRGYESLHYLRSGDRLKVFNEDGSVFWKGVIDLEFETGQMPIPGNPFYKQQSALGYWVHGCQRGFDLNEWAQMFFAGLYTECKYKNRLKAELTTMTTR